LSLDPIEVVDGFMYLGRASRGGAGWDGAGGRRANQNQCVSKM